MKTWAVRYKKSLRIIILAKYYYQINKGKKQATLKQIGNLLDKSFSKWEYIKAIKLSENESQTRDYLIEPFFNLLGYNKMEHYSHEFSLNLRKEV